MLYWNLFQASLKLFIALIPWVCARLWTTFAKTKNSFNICSNMQTILILLFGAHYFITMTCNCFSVFAVFKYMIWCLKIWFNIIYYKNNLIACNKSLNLLKHVWKTHLKDTERVADKTCSCMFLLKLCKETLKQLRHCTCGGKLVRAWKTRACPLIQTVQNCRVLEYALKRISFFFKYCHMTQCKNFYFGWVMFINLRSNKLFKTELKLNFNTNLPHSRQRLRDMLTAN